MLECNSVSRSKFRINQHRFDSSQNAALLIFIASVIKTINRFDNEQGVPWLARIPALGRLFKNQRKEIEKRDLLFFITP